MIKPSLRHTASEIAEFEPQFNIWTKPSLFLDWAIWTVRSFVPLRHRLEWQFNNINYLIHARGYYIGKFRSDLVLRRYWSGLANRCTRVKSAYLLSEIFLWSPKSSGEWPSLRWCVQVFWISFRADFSNFLALRRGPVQRSKVCKYQIEDSEIQLAEEM
jgi:hypothetical protein